MNYLVFDQSGELLDILNLNSEELALFKADNPTYVVKQETIVEDDFYFEIEDEDDLNDNFEEDEW